MLLYLSKIFGHICSLPYLSQNLKKKKTNLLLHFNVCKTMGFMANSVDQDQTPRSAASDLGLHFLLRPVRPGYSDKRGIRNNWTLKMSLLLEQSRTFW